MCGASATSARASARGNRPASPRSTVTPGAAVRVAASIPADMSIPTTDPE
jgi:hypothetical protein